MAEIQSGEVAKRERDWLVWITRICIVGLLGWNLIATIRLGNFEAARLEKDKAQAERDDEQDETIAGLKAKVETIADRQAARIPLFDEDHKRVEDHARRLQQIEFQIYGVDDFGGRR